MVIGTTIFYLDGNAYHSPTFSRGGLAATFSVDVTHLSLGAGVGLGIEVQHRNDEDTTWSSAGTFSSITSVFNLSLRDTEAPRLSKDVPPGSGPAAWNPGDKGRMPGTPVSPPPFKDAKREHARRKKRNAARGKR